MDEFDKAFDQFKSIRMESIANLYIYNSKDYKKLMADSNRLFSELYIYVKPQGMKLLMDYCNATTLLQGIAESMMYEQGLKDGVDFLNAIKIK